MKLECIHCGGELDSRQPWRAETGAFVDEMQGWHIWCDELAAFFNSQLAMHRAYCHLPGCEHEPHNPFEKRTKKER